METINTNYTGYAAEVNIPLIVLTTCNGTIMIPVQQIIRIQSISNYSKLFFKDGGTLVVAKVLRWFHEQDALASFIRIHRTHFVNSNYIKNYSGAKTGLLLLHNGEMFPVSRRKKVGLAKRLNNLNNSFTNASMYTSKHNTDKILAA
ncbi:MAG: LytTR family DNA-binding domain-containing protein [Ferruginibacter sp.]